MNGIAVLLSLATIGVDFGWQPMSDGRLEYIIQLRPAETAALQGDGIVSEIPSEVQNVRRIRVLVGTAKLPQVGAAPAGFAAGADAALSQGGRTGLNAAGVLDLPPPPPLLGPDGKTSVLVRPGERALPGIARQPMALASPPPSAPSFDLGNPGVPAIGAGGFSSGLGAARWVPAGGIAPPGNTGSGFNSPPAWGDGNTGGFSVPTQPVPSSGPESGFPTPIRGAQDNPKNQVLDRENGCHLQGSDGKTCGGRCRRDRRWD